MQLHESPLLSSDILEFRCDPPPDGMTAGAEVCLHEQGQAFLLRQEAVVCKALLTGPAQDTRQRVREGLTCWVIHRKRNDRLYIRYLKLKSTMSLGMSISVDERIAEALYRNREIARESVDLALSWLTRTFLVQDGIANDDGTPVNRNHPQERRPHGHTEHRAQVISGSSAGETVRQTEVPDNSRILAGWYSDTEHTDPVSGDEGSFLLLGAGWQARIKRQNGVLSVARVARFSNTDDIPATLLTGQITFVDASVSQRLQSESEKVLLDAALQQNGSYLQLWQHYEALEWRNAEKTAVDLGDLPFTLDESGPHQGERGWYWRLDVRGDALKDFRERWHDLSLTAETIVELTASVSPESRKQGTLQFAKDHIQFFAVSGPGASILREGRVSLSLSGSRTVTQRRQRARKNIQEGRGVPALYRILEGVTTPSIRRRFVPGMSASARKSFRGPPNDRQKQALDMAINTPDIALIIGPPGTGKTQVIAALQRRITELLGDGPAQYQLLISSYQHDAVDNALERAEVFGLPPVRVGGRRSTDQESTDLMEQWCKDKAREVEPAVREARERDPSCAIRSELQRVILRLKVARLEPDERQQAYTTINQLLDALRDQRVNIDHKAWWSWKRFFEKSSNQARTVSVPVQSASHRELIRVIRAVRTTPPSYLDDGPLRIDQLQRTLNRNGITLDSQQSQVLTRLSAQIEASDTELETLEQIKTGLLDRCLPDRRPTHVRSSLPEEALDLLNELEAAVQMAFHESRKSLAWVLDKYHRALDMASLDIIETIREYSSVVGATCQQSAGKQMTNLLELGPSKGIQFNTVIVDEAARANPLDLLVPMSMATRRIILVGDHLQLPHLLLPELEDQLAEEHNLSDKQKKALSESLFERLYRQLKEQNARDGVQRVVMLDTQYRMHPTLGDFISRQFYEANGLGTLKSGRPAEDFAHNVPGYEGRCAAWLDVPRTKDRSSHEDRTRGGSRIRRSEAVAIGGLVKSIRNACGPDLSIGVISFYRAQCNLILEELEHTGIAERDERDVLRVADAWSRNPHGEERLRVGTVDAFQGKEFDIVILSVVRANSHSYRSPEESQEARDKRLTRRFGHLRIANRMNVAMSRQRRLLIVVGDSQMARDEDAKEAIPALAAFLKLCEEERRRVQ